MGGVKAMMMEALEKGSDIDNDITVCTECFGNAAIKEFISNNDTGTDCTYCSKRGSASCSLEIVLEHIMTCIRAEWGQPENVGLGYITREGGWQGQTYDSSDLFDLVGVEINNNELQDYIMSSLSDDVWCEQYPYSLSGDKILYIGWKQFSEFVKNEVRYMFLNTTPSTYDQHQHDEIHPVDILEALANITKELNLIELWKKEQEIFRVRVVEDHDSFHNAKELGTPPREFASIPNRMSPSGIPMFYGAFDKQTAVCETYNPKKSTNKKVIFGVFHPTQDLVLLNLSKHISVPDLFDEKTNNKRESIKFLVDFIDDFSKPITRDDRSHVEYVPTQIVTEYFKHIFRSDKGKKLDGIIYPSSKKKNYFAVVIFADNSQCADKALEYEEGVLLFLDRTEELYLNNPVTTFV